MIKNLFDKMKKEGIKADLKNGDRLEVILYKGANLGMGKRNRLALTGIRGEFHPTIDCFDRQPGKKLVGKVFSLNKEKMYMWVNFIVHENNAIDTASIGPYYIKETVIHSYHVPKKEESYSFR